MSHSSYLSSSSPSRVNVYFLSIHSLFSCLFQIRELRVHIFWARVRVRDRPGPDRVQIRARSGLDSGPARTRPGGFFTNIQHPVCTWAYADHSLTTYNWLFRENNRYTIISCYLFLSINAPKIKSCRLVEKKKNGSVIHLL
jgi:hypothetical protein